MSYKFSVLMPAYHKDRPEWLAKAIQSILEQTLRPAEIVIVKDGPLPEPLDLVIKQFEYQNPNMFKILALPTNQGVGAALAEGLLLCTHELVARMDADDIALPFRFEKQVEVLKSHPEIAVLGSSVSEFEEDPNFSTGIRTQPLDHDSIVSYAKNRNPINHMTAFFRKSAVLKVGNYKPTFAQDYHLWVRMIIDGYQFLNLEEVLVHARTGKGFLSRRAGWQYYKKEMKLIHQFVEWHFISRTRLLVTALPRLLIRSVPPTILQAIYHTFLRKKSTNKVTVALYGGLGNQLFQYSFGRSLAKRARLRLELDTYGFDFDKFYGRKLELGAFSITPVIFSKKPIGFHAARFFRFLANFFPYLKKWLRPSILLDSLLKHSQIFDQEIQDFQPSRSSYVLGYWQDERYFLNVHKELRNELSLKKQFSPANQKVLASILDSESVSLHCRQLHGVGVVQSSTANSSSNTSFTLGMDYYNSAVAIMGSKLVNPTFFVFSDSPAWARKHFSLPYKTIFLEEGRGPDFEDLGLMSKCKHHIIANSSFSWWGAWLAESPGQVVIAPKSAPYLPNVPERWITVE